MDSLMQMATKLQSDVSRLEIERLLRLVGWNTMVENAVNRENSFVRFTCVPVAEKVRNVRESIEVSGPPRPLEIVQHIRTWTRRWRYAAATKPETTKIIRRAVTIFARTRDIHAIVAMPFPEKKARKWNQFAIWTANWRNITASGVRYNTRYPFRVVFRTDRGGIPLDLGIFGFRDSCLAEDYRAEIRRVFRNTSRKIEHITAVNRILYAEIDRTLGLLELLG